MRWAASPQQSALAVQAFGLERSFKLVVVTLKNMHFHEKMFHTNIIVTDL